MVSEETMINLPCHRTKSFFCIVSPCCICSLQLSVYFFLKHTEVQVFCGVIVATLMPALFTYEIRNCFAVNFFPLFCIIFSFILFTEIVLKNNDELNRYKSSTKSMIKRAMCDVLKYHQKRR